jgi:hypothetical protein
MKEKGNTMDAEGIILQMKNIEEALEEVRDELGDPSADQVISAETAIILSLSALDHAIGELEDLAESQE